MSKRKLTKQQLHRIRKNQDERVSRAKDKSVDSSEEEFDGEHLPGIIVSQYGVKLDVEDTEGNIVRCHARQNLGSIVCGDKVYWNKGQDATGVVTALEPRQSLLTRSDFHGNLKPVAANIDQIIIVCAIKPAHREELIDKYLVAAEDLGITPVIAFNKADMLDEMQAKVIKTMLENYSTLGYSVVMITAIEAEGLNDLVSIMDNKTSILAGQSGVGKSTIINHLLPHENVKVGSLSDSKDKGRHTTTVSRLYHLPHNGNIIDSPGVRDFGLRDVGVDEIIHGFIEFRPFIGKCKFKNCAHLKDTGCAIKAAVLTRHIKQRRLDSYHQIIDQLTNITDK